MKYRRLVSPETSGMVPSSSFANTSKVVRLTRPLMSGMVPEIGLLCVLLRHGVRVELALPDARSHKTCSDKSFETSGNVPVNLFSLMNA